MNVQAPLPTESPILESQRDIAQANPRTQISLVDLWQVAVTRKRVMLGAAGALLGLIVLVTYSLTPLYKGTAIVMLDQQQTNVVDVQLVLSGLPTDQTSILDQIQILKSRSLASRVIADLKLNQDPEFNSALKHSWTSYISWLNPLHWIPRRSIDASLSPDEIVQKEQDAVVDNFENRLSVDQLELSTSIEIDFESESPGKAARIANAIADAYIVDQLNKKFEATRRATQWLSSQLAELARRANAAEVAAVKYRAEKHITDVASASGTGTVSVLDQQIGSVNTELLQARTDRTQAQATLDRVRALVQSGHAVEVSQVINSPLITQLRAQQATLIQQQAQMASRYGPENPKMLDLKAEQRDLDAKITEEISHIVASVQNDVSVAESRETALSSSLAHLEGRSSLQGEARIQLAELEANAASSRELYNTFLARSKQTQEQQGLQLPDARVISRAPIPLKTSYPNKLVAFGIGLPAALFFGFLIAFVMERLDHGFRIASRVEDVLGYPVLATLPDLKSLEKQGASNLARSSTLNAADLVIDRPLSSYTEAIRGLHMGLTLSNVDRIPKVIIVTSSVPSEGKTTLSVSLARHVAQSGQKVVLVDCDLRRPNVRVAAGLKVELDIIDVLRGACKLEDALMKDPKSSLQILPAIKQIKNAPDLLASEAMERIIAKLRSEYDLVVIDSAPVLPVNDTKVLTPHVDSVLFVVRWENTPRDAAAEAVKSLREIRAPIAGIALTRADTQRFQYYSFGYGSYGGSYLEYYGDGA